jgi:protein-S-isoprenylcysteine O-methyltransferase Ste14
MRLPDLGRRGQGWVWLQVILMAGVPLVAGSAPPWPSELTVAMAAIGAILVVAGCVLMVVGILGLGASFAVPPGPGSGAELVTTGVYARARHPIFGAWILMGWGFGVALSPWAVPVAALLTLELLGKTAVEERFLLVRYPAYDDYRTRVRRKFLPRLRRPEQPGTPDAGSTLRPSAHRA